MTVLILKGEYSMAQHDTAPGPSTVLTVEEEMPFSHTLCIHGTVWVPTYVYNNKGNHLGYR